MKGDWTDDTDQLLLILQMIVERKGTVEKRAFAEKIFDWRRLGFKDLGDVGTYIDSFVHPSLTTPSLPLSPPLSASTPRWDGYWYDSVTDPLSSSLL